MKSRVTRGKRTIWLIAFCLALGGCGGSSTLPPGPTSPPAPGASATVFFCTISDPQCRTSINSFEVSQLRDLYVFVTWPGVVGQHTEVLGFILPDGNLYQRLEVDFDTATAPTSQGDPVAVAVLPVAGTFITQRSLLGTWTVNVFLNDRFVTQAIFTLEPGGP